MKKISIALVAILMATGLFAQDLNISTGFSAGFIMDTQSQTAGDIKTDATSNLLSVGAFVDATYVLVGVDYVMSVGDSDTKSYNVGSLFLETTSAVKTSALVLNLLGKYPVEVGAGITLALATGVSYRLNLTYEDADFNITKEDLSDEVQEELNDFILNLGVLGDFLISETLFLRGSFLFGINLTAEKAFEKGVAEGLGQDYSAVGFVPNLSLGLGFRL